MPGTSLRAIGPRVAPSIGSRPRRVPDPALEPSAPRWPGVRAVGPSWVAGLGAMLCGPMMMHAHGHLETMQMGAVPLFLVAWIRFIDRPGIGRLGGSAGLYLLMVSAAPYFAVLAVFPAVWYVGW